MQKFHLVRSTGKIAPCKALYRACPHDSPEMHYASAEDAQAAFEAEMQGDIFTVHKNLQEDDQERVRTIAFILKHARGAGESFTVRSMSFSPSQEKGLKRGEAIVFESKPLNVRDEAQVFLKSTDFGRKLSAFVRTPRGVGRAVDDSQVVVGDHASQEEAFAYALLKVERLTRQQFPELVKV